MNNCIEVDSNYSGTYREEAVNQKIKIIKKKTMKCPELSKEELNEIVQKVKKLIHEEMQFNARIPKKSNLLEFEGQQDKNKKEAQQLQIANLAGKKYYEWLSRRDKVFDNATQGALRMLAVITDNTPNSKYINSIFKPCVEYLQQLDQIQDKKIVELDNYYSRAFQKEYHRWQNLKYGTEIVKRYGSLAGTRVPIITLKYNELRAKVVDNNPQYLRITGDRVDYMCSSINDNIGDYFQQLWHRPNHIFYEIEEYHFYDAKVVNVCVLDELLMAFNNIENIISYKYENLMKSKDPYYYYVKDSNGKLQGRYCDLYFSKTEKLDIEEIYELLEEFDRIKLCIKAELEKIYTDEEFLNSEFKEEMQYAFKGLHGYEIGSLYCLFQFELSEEKMLKDYFCWIFNIDGKEKPQYDLSVAQNFWYEYE